MWHHPGVLAGVMPDAQVLSLGVRRGSVLPQHGHNMPVPYKISLVGHKPVTGEVRRGAQPNSRSPESKAKTVVGIERGLGVCMDNKSTHHFIPYL